VAFGERFVMSRMLCAVFRSRRNADTYLFVDHQEGFSRVPEALLREFGGAERAMTLALTPERRLARAEAVEVLRAIEQQGFYLQLPPVTADRPGSL
jgi:uncharacterized protein YcgL (UPF0745 family)